MSDKLDEIAEPLRYERLSDVPSDKLAHNIVGSLILQKGNLNLYKEILRRFIEDYRQEIRAALDEAVGTARGPMLNVTEMIHEAVAERDREWKVAFGMLRDAVDTPDAAAALAGEEWTKAINQAVAEERKAQPAVRLVRRLCMLVVGTERAGRAALPRSEGISRRPRRPREGEPMKDRGLYEKFDVTRTDGKSEPGEKHNDCRYFVLDIDHDKHAEAALRAYAESCRDEYPELSVDLLRVFAEAPADRGEQFNHLLHGGKR